MVQQGIRVSSEHAWMLPNLSYADILGLVALVPYITHSLSSTKFAHGLNVHPHQLNLQLHFCDSMPERGIKAFTV